MTRRSLFVVATIISVLLLLLALGWFNGIRINRSESLPDLLWRLEPLSVTDTTILQRGQPVFICPPDTAIFRLAQERAYVPFGLSCPGYSASLLKPVAAIPGDHIDISQQGIRVNGQLQANSKPLQTDGRGRPMPVLSKREYTLQNGQFWLLSSYTQRSFDSRYFGPIEQQHIIGRAIPVTVVAW